MSRCCSRRELAYGRETSAIEGTREFVFKHHVLHQVAYQGVLKQSRREQHRLTADWLVVRSGDRASECFGLIAEHYERAGDIAHAVEYLRRAGEDAARSYVNAAALDYLGRALALVPADDAATRFALLETRRAIYSNTGRRGEQAEDVAALEQAAEQLDDDAFRARAGRCCCRWRAASRAARSGSPHRRAERAPGRGRRSRARPR